MNEFSLIDRFFKAQALTRNDVIFGIGDDAACVEIAPGNQLLVSTDTLVSGVHFLPEWDPYAIACKAVLVNISDMAAMAAEPCWVTLALTLPEVDAQWLEGFSRGVRDTLSRYGINLIGGDTTKGPLSITITIMGQAPRGKAIRRSGAQEGDVILVSGLLGAAALAVSFLEKNDLPATDKNVLMQHLLHPRPRTDLIDLLRSFATSAIDISDGLSADLYHICEESTVGATLQEDALPLHPLLPKYLGPQAIDLALRGGDDYELCFTVPKAHIKAFNEALKHINTVCYPIGTIEQKTGLRIQKPHGALVALEPGGYTHF